MHGCPLILDLVTSVGHGVCKKALTAQAGLVTLLASGAAVIMMRLLLPGAADFALVVILRLSVRCVAG